MKILIIIFVVSLILMFILRPIGNYLRPSDPIEHAMWRVGNGLDSYTITITLVMLAWLTAIISGGIIAIKLLIKYLC